jgi:hypothetical protein
MTELLFNSDSDFPVEIKDERRRDKGPVLMSDIARAYASARNLDFKKISEPVNETRERISCAFDGTIPVFSHKSHDGEAFLNLCGADIALPPLTEEGWDNKELSKVWHMMDFLMNI